MKKPDNIFKFYVFTFLRNFELVMPVLVLFYLDNNLTYANIFFLQAWFTLIIMIFEIPSGALSDFFGRKKTLLISGFIHAFACWIYSISKSFGMFLVCETFWGISAAFASGTLQAFVYDSLKDYKRENEAKQVFAKVQTISLLSKAVSAVIGAYIASIYSYRFVFFLTTFSFLAAFITSLFFNEPKCLQTVKRVTLRDYIKQIKDGLNILRGSSILIFLTVESTIINTCIALSFWFFQPLLQSRGLAIANFGLVIAMFNIFSASGVILAPKCEKMIGAQKTILFSELFPTIFMIVVGIWINLYVAIIGFIIIHGINMIRMALFNDYFNRYIDTQQRATVLSLISFLGSLSYAILGPIVGKITDYTGLDVILTGIGVVTGILIIMLGFMRQRLSQDLQSLNA
ncbi:hypothetical protein BBF96_00550 [Anoxybacter fermentans]|uniref:Major facilitator superfamily (MFS) profile domain-containing protein n=1 Tax=Anoxybacter fermentans TaxID=1323375 RepID=A0A3Q9HNF3_9FIRM|nr:MFS transporter [Anoxybacter fermentans]AZR72025.1 hypothetical protein BBF96_00550 [Anoxybacter fermentans]